MVDQAFEDILNAKPVVEGKLRQLGPETDADPHPVLRSALQSLWKFLEAVTIVRSAGDLNQASELFQASAEGFGTVGFDELRDLCVGMGVYTIAVVQLQAMNIGQAMDVMAKVKDYLRSAGQYGSAFEPLIDHMQPDAFFVGGGESLDELRVCKC